VGGGGIGQILKRRKSEHIVKGKLEGKAPIERETFGLNSFQAP
jgi:hypothetical protein